MVISSSQLNIETVARESYFVKYDSALQLHYFQRIKNCYSDDTVYYLIGMTKIIFEGALIRVKVKTMRKRLARCLGKINASETMKFLCSRCGREFYNTNGICPYCGKHNA